MRTRSISLAELTVPEANRILKDKTFDSLKPSQCSQCKQTTGFTRRIFRILGVKRTEYSDDAVQSILVSYFRQQYATEYICFKTHRGKFLADSAACTGCGSTAIVYDITYDDALFSKVASVTGRSNAQVKRDLERLRKQLAGD